MSNGFEFYQGTTSEATTPKITVRKGGQLVLTSGAVEMLGEIDSRFRKCRKISATYKTELAATGRR